MYNNQQNLNENRFIEKFWHFKGKIFLLGILVAMLFFIISAIMPSSYKAFASIAINLKRTAGIDAYREAKSSEFMARTVKEMIMANSFMKSVLKDSEINWPEMNKIKAEDKKIEYWKKKVKVSVIPNTGVLSIFVYTRDRELSRKILVKIIKDLQKEKSSFFDSKGVKIEMINEPYYFYKQATPNLELNTVLGFVIGVVVAIVIIIFNEDFFKYSRKVKVTRNIKKGIVYNSKINNKYTELSSEDIELFNEGIRNNFNFK